MLNVNSQMFWGLLFFGSLLVGTWAKTLKSFGICLVSGFVLAVLVMKWLKWHIPGFQCVDSLEKNTTEFMSEAKKHNFIKTWNVRIFSVYKQNYKCISYISNFKLTSSLPPCVLYRSAGWKRNVLIKVNACFFLTVIKRRLE